MRILAFIPARGGSKRLPGKNVRTLGGKPLLVWSIDVCDGIHEICDILVSTDDAYTAEIARQSGALVPWLRPPELATDNVTTKEVALHALDWYERENGELDALLLLQPTSPYRTRDTVYRGIDLFRKNGQRPVVSVSPALSHPLWCLKVENDGMRPFLEDGGLHLRSQELPPVFTVNGAFYLITPEDLRLHQSFYSPDMIPLHMTDPFEVLDIDTEYDWVIAEAFQKL